MTRRWSTAALFAIAFSIAGLVALAIAFGGTSTYRSIMREYSPATFHVSGPTGPRVDHVPLDALTDWHNGWFAYVTGDAERPPVSFGARMFTASEYAHMADVRNVFVGARIAAAIAAAVAGVLLAMAWRRDPRAALVLARDGTAAAAVGMAVVGALAAVAFDPLFLLFHEILFPQGNFLFGPDSNLIAMYPDEYWSGVVFRVGIAFVAATAIIAVGATATLRRARR